MPNVNVDGIAFDLALSDAEVLDLRIEDRDEFLAAWEDYFDHEPSDDEILEFARERLSDKAQRMADWPLEPEWSRNGCRSPWHAAEGV